MKREQMSTMRRKVIEEGRGQREAAKAASSQNASLEGLSESINELQIASELSSEVIETKSNQIIDSINEVNQSVIDTTAGSELVAEASERTSRAVEDNTNVSERISDKLTRLTEMLNEKLGVATSNLPSTTTPDNTAAVINDTLPVEIVNPTLPELIEGLLPNSDNGNNKPEDSFFPPVPSEPSPKEEKKKSESDTLSDLLKTTKSGFKATVSITDRIASMLFKYTVSAIAEAAKMAALIFSIVLGIDVLMTHFKYWSNKFSTDFDSFSTEAAEWGSTLSSIFGTLENIKAFWEAGDWGGLAVAVVSGVTEILYNLGELISLGMSKVAASILSAIPGLEDTALSIEGAALEGFQERTGSALSDENQETLAKYQSSKIEKGENLFDKFSQAKTYLLNKVTGDANTSDFVDRDERDQEVEALRKLDPKEREAVLRKGNEARAAIIRFEKYIEDVNPNNAKSVEAADKAYANLKEQVSDSDLNKSATTKKELNGRFGLATAKYDKLKGKDPVPAPASESDDSKRVEKIEKAAAVEKSASAGTGAGNAAATLFNTNNMINNSKVVNNHAPITSTSAPGIFGATGIN